MLETKKEAATKMAALAPEIKTAIAQRFTNLSTVTNDIAARMGNDVPFPEALVQAVKERDPGLANEIENRLTPEISTEASTVPQIGMSTSFKAGISSARAAGEVKVGAEVSGESFGLQISAGAAMTEDRTDITASGTATIGDIELGILRDPLKEVGFAGLAGIYKEIVPGLYVGGGMEGGVDTEGFGYVVASASVSGGSKGIEIEVTPFLTVAPEVSLGIEISAVYAVTENCSVTADFYKGDVTSADITATAGVRISL